MNLIPLWAKALIAALLAAIVFGAGWKVRGWKDDAAHKAEVEQMLSDQTKEIEDYRAKFKVQQDLAAKDRKVYFAERADFQKRIEGFEEEIRNAPLNTVTPRQGESSVPADEPFNREFVRLWNAPIQAVNGLGGAAGSGPQLAGADTTAARVTREDVLNNHRLVLGMCGDWKQRLDKIIASPAIQGAQQP